MRPSRHIAVRVAATGVLLAAGSGLYQVCWPYHGHTPRTFSPHAWAAADADSRGHMVDDLLRSHPLVGRTAGEVRTLLGAPDDSGTHGLTYQVGHMGFNRHAPMVLSYTLTIELDERGRVVRTFVHD